MKKYILLPFLLICSFSYSQNPSVTSIIEVCSGVLPNEAPQNSYFTDINNKFQPFIGTWVYVNGDNKVTFSIKKITKKYFKEEKTFEDFLVGNYSYSNDGGSTYIVNTINLLTSTNPAGNPMYAPCADQNIVDFNFIDVLLDKHYCNAVFEFLPGSLTQMKVKISGGETFRFEDEPAITQGFTLPQNMIVTKVN